MLFIDFLGKSKTNGSSTRFSLENTVVGDGESPFSLFNIEYNEEGNKILLSDMSGEDNKVAENLFKCDEEYANKIAKGTRSKEDDILILTDRVRFVDGVKAYFSVIPFEDSMLVALHAGVLEIKVGDDWIPFVRSNVGFDLNSPRFEYIVSDLYSMISAVDKDTKYNKVFDGVSLVEMLISIGKDGAKSVSCRSKSDYFTLLNSKNLEKAQGKKVEQDRVKEEEHIRKMAERAENERIQKRFAEQREAEEREKKEALDKARREKAERKREKANQKAMQSKVENDNACEMFKNIIAQRGFIS